MIKKIFITLITIVALVVLGAFILNILVPNVATSLVDYAEDMVFNASGADFDWNGNGNSGKTAGTQQSIDGSQDKSTKGTGVTGFQ